MLRQSWLGYVNKLYLNGFEVGEQEILAPLLGQDRLLLLGQSVLHLLQNVSFLTDILNAQLVERKE